MVPVLLFPVHTTPCSVVSASIVKTVSTSRSSANLETDDKRWAKNSLGVITVSEGCVVTELYSIVQYSRVQYSTVEYSTVQ